MTENVPKKEGYGYLCVIHGLVLGSADVQSFEAYMKARCNVRVQYLETYKTCPSVKDGVPVPETGGRSDVIFAIHRDDYSNLHIGHRLDLGIRWLDDAIANEPEIYEQRIHDYFK